MSKTLDIPTPLAVRTALSQLVGRPVDQKPAAPLVPGTGTPAIVALYRRGDGVVAAVCCADVALSAHAGAALTMVPATVSEAQAKRGLPDVDEVTFDNFREVLNVFAALFNTDGGAHVKLAQVLRVPADAVPDDVTSLLSAPRARLDVDLSISGYGSGVATFVVS